MLSRKAYIRQVFRDAVFERANYKCEIPGCNVVSNQEDACDDLDVHHITNRKLFKFGGYVKENGIAVCPACHFKAEQFWATGTASSGYHPDDLYEVIASSLEEALKADKDNY